MLDKLRRIGMDNDGRSQVLSDISHHTEASCKAQRTASCIGCVSRTMYMLLMHMERRAHYTSCNTWNESIQFCKVQCMEHRVTCRDRLVNNDVDILRNLGRISSSRNRGLQLKWLHLLLMVGIGSMVFGKHVHNPEFHCTSHGKCKHIE